MVTRPSTSQGFLCHFCEASFNFKLIVVLPVDVRSCKLFINESMNAIQYYVIDSVIKDRDSSNLDSPIPPDLEETTFLAENDNGESETPPAQDKTSDSPVQGLLNHSDENEE